MYGYLDPCLPGVPVKAPSFKVCGGVPTLPYTVVCRYLSTQYLHEVDSGRYLCLTFRNVCALGASYLP